ncbi:MAG: hypothetical protein KF725_09020 [Cyclobacteriaceae bacterium]|nr:hypothetical protein [Cyclobacteriaceae bacterium]UYN88086.1 MAG: hypothetical protein KIT51_07520 [Cyclobacteriaceae bacterium]
MRKIAGKIVYGFVLMALPLFAQKIDEARMGRDIAVAENVLKTLIRQQFDKQRMFFGLEVEGSYQAGYGVTFRLPADFTTPIAMSFSGDFGDMVWIDGERPGSFSYSVTSPSSKEIRVLEQQAREEAQRAREEDQRVRLKGKASRTSSLDMDSVRNAYNEKLLVAVKDFLVDYGDMISQLGANERIVITNRGDRPRVWVNQFFTTPKRSYLSAEIAKTDMAAFKQGKLTREQALGKVKVVNTESVDAVEPDLELLSSIFNRLYRSDLASTFFTDEGIYFERLKDFGAVYYMRVYSSNQSRNSGLFNMPTAKLNDVDQVTRDKKVKEMYPAFEKELKENMVEYGRTLKSIGENESLVFNVTLTKCEGCGIPSSLELSVKGSVLKDYSAGKISKDAAIGKISAKRGQNQ